MCVGVLILCGFSFVCRLSQAKASKLNKYRFGVCNRGIQCAVGAWAARCSLIGYVWLPEQLSSPN